MGLKGAKEYAAFSKDFYEGYDRSEELLNYPERVSEDAYVALSSALWKFMEPMNNGPSSHSVMTGFYVPNASDNQAGHKDGFGTTTFAIAKELCSDWNKSQGSKDRADYFNDMLEDLGLDKETSNLYCEKMWSDFAWGGSSNKKLYFAREWGSV